MGKNILYIIGNGFDLHHGIKSKYSNFKNYLKEKDPELLEALEKYFPYDSLWSDFETTLAYLDTDEMVEEAEIFLMSYSDPNWRDSGHHDYQYELGKSIDFVTSQLKQRFIEWILQLSISKDAHQYKLNLPSAGKFLNFNYTSTLEKIYSVK